MSSFSRFFLLIILFFWICYRKSQVESLPEKSCLPLITSPVYHTHRFEMELHKDTMFYPILILEGWDLIFPIFCNSWYPTCGGCIVYDNWPYPPGFPYPSFDKASMIGWPLANTNQDTLSSSADSLLVAKEPTVMSDSVTIAPIATVPTSSRWTRFKQKVRSFRIFSSS
jgi:hypothetical protein